MVGVDTVPVEASRVLSTAASKEVTCIDSVCLATLEEAVLTKSLGSLATSKRVNIYK